MTTYFDGLASEVRVLSEESRGDADRFLDCLGVVEKTLAETASLNSGDREFPEDLREKVQSAIALHVTTACNGSRLGDAFYAKARRLALATRRSRLVGELHEVFHELAGRRLVTRFGSWTDDPAANLRSRELHDQAASGELACALCACERDPDVWLGHGKWFATKPDAHAAGCPKNQERR